MALPTKDELGAKLLDYPLLRQLLFERWFRLAFAVFVLVFVFLGLFLPKIWTASKPGFVPVIKISGLDLVQAWSLKRTALKAAAAGKFEDANYAWQSAFANNRADPDLVRGTLRNLLKDPHHRENAGLAVQQSFWLLRLTGTNLVDLELATQALEQFRYYDPILNLLEPRVEQLTPPLMAVYLKSLFIVGRETAFRARWDQFKARLPGDPELPVYRAAYLAGWGPTETATEARQQLEAAAQDPALRILAYRLKLALSVKELDSAAYGAALKQLEDAREDTLNQHAGYWRLLANTGHKDEAARLVQEYPHPPGSAYEAAELAQSYADLGLTDPALQVLKRYTKDYGHAAVFWVTYASLLLDLKRWDDLREVALQIRSQDGMRDQLGGFSYFLDGRAELALGRGPNADAAFEKAAQSEFPFAGLAQKVASQLFQMGHADLARQLLVRSEKLLGKESAYWILVFRVADQLKDVDLLVKAATQAHELNPKDPAVINNYAAALIITRQRPDEVIKMTLPLISENPDSLYAVVNHSAALLLNGRPKEAAALLGRVQTNTLTAAQLSLYNLDLFEICVGLGKLDQARMISDQIEPKYLYPTQVRWLEQARQQLPPKGKAG